MSIKEIQKKLFKQMEATKDDMLRNVLGQIMTFLKQSENGMDMSKIKQALTYIAKMPIENSHPLANLLTNVGLFDKKATALINLVRKQPSSKVIYDKEMFIEMTKDVNIYRPPLTPASSMTTKPLSNNARDILKELYIALAREYKEPVWTFSYPSGVFEEWQKSIIEGTKYDTTQDTKRGGVMIGGQKDETESGIREKIKQLLIQTEYSKEEKSKLIDWVMAYGNQKMATSLFDLFKDRHFGNKEIEPGISQINANWTVEDGNLMLIQEIKVASASIDNQFLIADSEGDEPTADPPEEKLKEYQNLRNEFKELPALIHLKNIIVLDVMNGKVEPKVTECKIVSYTKQLESPAKLFGPVAMPKFNKPNE